MPILVNNHLVDDQLIREESRLLRARIRLEAADPTDELRVDLEAREWARENVIMRVLLQQEAGTGSPEELMGWLMAKVARPKNSEITAHYRQFPEAFQRPEMVRAAHIVKNVDAATGEAEAATVIQDIERQLKSGADFRQLADLASDCPGEGGDLGFFARGDMVPEFERVVFSLRPGEISGVFRSTFGFHIAKLAERRKAGLAPLTDVREQIERDLWAKKKQHAANDFMQKLRVQADIRKA